MALKRNRQKLDESPNDCQQRWSKRRINHTTATYLQGICATRNPRFLSSLAFLSLLVGCWPEPSFARELPPTTLRASETAGTTTATIHANQSLPTRPTPLRHAGSASQSINHSGRQQQRPKPPQTSKEQQQYQKEEPTLVSSREKYKQRAKQKQQQQQQASDILKEDDNDHLLSPEDDPIFNSDFPNPPNNNDDNVLGDNTRGIPASLPATPQGTAFLQWCRTHLGIETLLDIRTFSYYDYMSAMPAEDWRDADEQVANVEQFPLLQVRGLAARRDIAQGEVVIRIPLQALFSVSTTIDQDPVLREVMGPDARRRHGWTQTATTGDEEEDSLFLLELPLLAMALLHHKRLGAASPLKHYLDILQAETTGRMPFLWSEDQLRAQVSEGIRTVARGVRRELTDMYETVAKVLMQAHSDLFPGNEDSGEFSLANFEWAFAMVQTRHWQLPIEDLEHNNPMYGDYMAPASMPTDEWEAQRQDVQQELDESGSANQVVGQTQPLQQQQQQGPESAASLETNNRHSFLAPVADLLNFGPPCTRGHYNRALHSFEIVASCDFVQGQEVTFWYSDECDHVLVGAYGFMHPMIPPCPSAEDYRQSAEEWQARAEQLQEKLERAHRRLKRVDETVDRLRDVLLDCDTCCEYDEEELLYDDSMDDNSRPQLQIPENAGENADNAADRDFYDKWTTAATTTEEPAEEAHNVRGVRNRAEHGGNAKQRSRRWRKTQKSALDREMEL